MKDIEAMVRLSYPQTNRPGGKSDEAGRYVNLRIEDRASGEILADLELSAVEWTQILSCQMTPVADGARTGDHLDRVGKRLETDVISLGHGLGAAEDAIVAETIVKALAFGWETAVAGRRNYGAVVECRRWV